MFDLRPTIPEARQQSRGRMWIIVAMGVFFIVLGVGLSLPRLLNGSLTSGSSAGLVGGVVLGVILIGMGFAMKGMRGAPVSIGVDATGVTLYYERSPQRTFPWAKARSWLELIDMRTWTPSGSRAWRPPAPFYFRGGLVFGLLWIPEQAGEAVLTSARQAGVNLRSFQNHADRHIPRGATVYVESDRKFL